MNYISKQDGKSFTTEKELIKHLLNNYSMQVEESNYNDLIDKINAEAPLVEVLSVEKYKDKGLEVCVSYKNREGDSLESEDIIIGEVDFYDAYDIMKCKDESELIHYLNSYYNKYDEVEKLLIHKFNAKSCKLISIYAGSYDDSAKLCVEFYTDNEKYEIGYDFSDTMEQLYNQIESRFVKEIEGVVENYWDSVGHREVFRVSGVELKNFLKDGKNIKIKILD